MTTTYRRPLNTEQRAILIWVYSYRFSTCRQLAEILGRSNPKSIQKRLQILEAQGYIAKHYPSSYKLLGRQAEYYLTPLGGRQLNNTHPLAIKGLYKNKSVSDNFIQHCLAVTGVALALQAVYKDKIVIHTASTLKDISYVPTWLPDLIVVLTTNQGKLCGLLDVYDATKPFFVSVRKARHYISFVPDSDWLDANSSLPAILSVCHNEKYRQKLNRQIKKALDEMYEDDLIFATTTISELVNTASASSAIWGKVDIDDGVESVRLTDLLTLTQES